MTFKCTSNAEVEAVTEVMVVIIFVGDIMWYFSRYWPCWGVRQLKWP